MNNQTNSAESHPNPSFEPCPTPHRFTNGVKRFLYCNPFYLASAALLLFGLYRVSGDANFLPLEIAQLKFNFVSLQLYELLMVVTAVVLARRRIWYDAKLLVTMENLLVLVPFMLVSQAALIDPRTVWIFCGAAACLALGRSALAQRGVAALRFPPSLVAIGAVVLAVNAAWPVIYRILHETKFGTKLESGAAFEMHRLGWWLLLPALIALANLLPRPREDGESPAPVRRFPVGMLSLWLAGTAVHLYALGYVYDFDLRREWLAPAIWMLTWTLHWRLPEYAASFAFLTRKITLALPLPVTLIAAGEAGSNVCFALSALNFLVLACVVWNERGHRLAQHLALISLATMVATVPAMWFQPLAGWFNRPDLIALAVLGYAIIVSLLTRNPKAAVLGGLAAAVAGGGLRELYGDAGHWAAQMGLVFLLLHSLRWRDYEHPGTVALRGFAAAAWLIHSVIWVGTDAVLWHPLITAGATLFVCCWRGFIFQRWTPRVVPLTAVGVALCGPAHFLFVKLQSTPPGVMAIVGSFLLFALGTALALTKHRWDKPAPH